MLELIKSAGSTVPAAGTGKVVLFVNATGAISTKDESGTEAALGAGGAANSFVNIAVSGQPTIAADNATDTLTLVAGAGIALTNNAITDTITIDATPSFAFGNIVISGQPTVAADAAVDTLTLVAGTNVSLVTNAATDTITINSTPPNTFSTIAVSGQPDVLADNATDTLTLVAGAGIALTNNATTDSITIDTIPAFSFGNIAISGQPLVAADSALDTLTLIAGTNITLTSNAATDSITINSTGIAGASVPTFGADTTAGRDFATADLGKLLNYNSASVGTLVVPTDAALGLTGSFDSTFFKVFIKGTGRADIVAGPGVTVRNYAGFPTPIQYVMQTCTRVGTNEWAVE